MASHLLSSFLLVIPNFLFASRRTVVILFLMNCRHVQLTKHRNLFAKPCILVATKAVHDTVFSFLLYHGTGSFIVMESCS